jgi:hypothetical protein
LNLKFKKKKKEIIERDDYYHIPKDYTQLQRSVKYICICMLIATFALASYKAIKNDTTEIENALDRVDQYISKVDFTKEDSLKSFAESFTEIYLSSEIDSKDRKTIMQRYVSNYSDFVINYAGATKFKVKSTSLRKIDEVSKDLINASVLARVEITTTRSDNTTSEAIETRKIKDYILKLPIKVTKTADREFSYLIYKSPTFEPLPELGEDYQGKFIKLSKMSPIKTSKVENTVKSFLKVYFEGTNEEIRYFYVGSDEVNGFRGEMKLRGVSTDVYEIEGSDDLIAYSKVEVSDAYGTYKSSYEFKLTEKDSKWFIKNFGVKDSEITVEENREE